MIKDFHRIVINLNQNEINDLLDYFNEARKETLKEVEKIIDKSKIWKLNTYDMDTHKTTDKDELIRKSELKQEINKLKEDLRK